MTDVVLKLSARDLVHADLASCGWAGSEHHLTRVAEQLERARTGEVDYLAVCAATNIPVAKGGVDYRVKEGVGTLWQLAVHPALQSCGIGTFLVGAAEARIRNRGLRRAELGVEENNPPGASTVRTAGICRVRPSAGRVGGANPRRIAAPLRNRVHIDAEGTRVGPVTFTVPAGGPDPRRSSTQHDLLFRGGGGRRRLRPRHRVRRGLHRLPSRIELVQIPWHRERSPIRRASRSGCDVGEGESCVRDEGESPRRGCVGWFRRSRPRC